MTRLITAIGGLLWLLVLQTGCTFVISGSSIDGRVVDSETGAPIAGALVIAEWSGDIGGPVHSKTVCVHMEIATTDANGRYHIPGWSRRPVADWEGGLFGLRNVEVSRRTYKAGYAHLKYDASDSTRILMQHFQGSSADRIEYLTHEGTAGCGATDGSLIKELAWWTAICEESKAYREARIPQERFANKSFLDNVDLQIEAIGKQLEASGNRQPANQPLCVTKS